MSEEAKTSEVNVNLPVPKPDVHADTQPKVSKFDQSKNPIPKVVPPRGSKDARSFRPSTLAEINLMNRYEPLEMKCGGKTWGIGCGNSLEDVLLISGCILALWSFVLGVSGLLLKSAIDTDRYATNCTFPFFFFFALRFRGFVCRLRITRGGMPPGSVVMSPPFGTPHVLCVWGLRCSIPDQPGRR